MRNRGCLPAAMAVAFDIKNSKKQHSEVKNNLFAIALAGIFANA